MKNIIDIYYGIDECGLNAGTPANTLGMGNPMVPGDGGACKLGAAGSEPLHGKCKHNKKRKIAEEPSKLKESILDDIDTQMNKGDDFIKTYKLAQKELDDIKKICSDLSNWTGDEYENENAMSDFRGIVCDYKIFIKCGKLSKLFDLIGKNMFIKIAFYPGMKSWTVDYQLTNANQAYPMPYRQNHLRIKSFKQSIEYRYNEIGFKPGAGMRSKYKPEQILKKFVLPKFKDVETFKKEFVDILKELETNNTIVKYIDGPSI